jgi:hypothetical protein
MTSAGKNIHKSVLANPHSPDWRIFSQNPDMCLPYFLQSCRTAGALVEPNLCDYVCYVVEKPLCPLKEKNIHEPVLVNPHSPNCHIFSQNSDMSLPYFLQRCSTSAALVVPNLCDYVCYVVEKPL